MSTPSARTAIDATLSERDFQAMVMTAAQYFGWLCYHTQDSRRATCAGYPDLHLLKPPHSLFAELKTARGRVRPEQQAWLDMLASCGIEVYLWRPADWDEIMEVLSA